jgi:O-antigen chain-terminating methyltransferase
VLSGALSVLRVSQSRRFFPGSEPPDVLVLDTPVEWESRKCLDDDSLLRALGDAFRGSSEWITEHVSVFLPYLREAAAAAPGMPVVDIGCGRGELLSLMRDAGIPGIGIDSNERQVAGLSESGLEVVVGHGNDFLENRAPASLAGVTAIAVAEHLQPDALLAFLREASRTVAPGGCIVVETSNPQCPLELAQFWLDPTHVRPYHPQMLAFYVAQMGFKRVRVVYSFPAPFPVRINGDDSSVYMAYAIVATRA